MPSGHYPRKPRSEATKTKISLTQKDRIFTEEHRRKLSEAKKGKKKPPISEEHKKKISVSMGGKNKLSKTSHYNRVHYWIKKQLGRPSHCEHCGCTGENTYEWSNISQEYKFEITDWQRLCERCHVKYDINFKHKNLKIEEILYV